MPGSRGPRGSAQRPWVQVVAVVLVTAVILSFVAGAVAALL